MRSLRYLNSVLTVIAVLLTLNLWTQWQGQEQASVLPRAQAAADAGFPNAAAQRKDMVDLLKALNEKTDQMLNLFRSGQARVRVDAMPSDNDKK